MTFLWPVLLVLLAIVPVLIAAYIWRLRRRRPSGARYSSLALIREAQPGTSRVRRHLPFVLFVGAVAALAVGLARPVAIVTVPANQTTIVTNQAKFDKVLANQTTIVTNQAKLDKVLANQQEILGNQKALLDR